MDYWLWVYDYAECYYCYSYILQMLDFYRCIDFLLLLLYISSFIFSSDLKLSL